MEVVEKIETRNAYPYFVIVTAFKIIVYKETNA
jgi:hypothetical protein